MRPACLRLLANAADVRTQKILVAARAAGVDLKLEACASGGNPELRRGDTVVRYTNAIIRYVGRVYEGTDVYGSSFIESALVDSWLDWAEMELGDDAPPHLEQAIQVLERHLSDRVFLVGQRFTLADASLSCSLNHIEKKGSALPRAAKRWLGTCRAHDAFVAVLGNVAPAAAAPAAVSKPTSQPGGAKPPAAQKTAAKPAPAAAPAAPAAAPAAPAAAQATYDAPLVDPYSSAVGGRTHVRRILQGADLVGKVVSACGWVKTKREANKGLLLFVEVNDGSCQASLQCVVDSSAPGFEQLKDGCGTGASVKCVGELVTSPGGKQAYELQVNGSSGHSVTLFGGVDAKEYPLAKKSHSMEFLRSIAHLRPRSNLIGSVARVRSALAFATHEFFQSQGFKYVHTPLITAADCEGAGEMFQVTTLLMDAEKEAKSGKGLNLPKTKEGKVDYAKDFFGKPSFLTVSGQLSVENYACALSSVYTFGPTFRAENSHTSRHLAEFWMIEPEICFADINDDMQCAEDYLKHCIRYLLANNHEDLEFFDKHVEKGLLQRLDDLIKQPFGRVTYTEAVEILIKESPKAKFEVPVEWGIDLGSEHERYLVEKVKKKPTIVYNYPKDIKAFYMRLNDDNKTVAAMDVLVPQIGEVIGGSQREERLDVLDRRLGEIGMPIEDYWWYRDLRRFGTVPHSGFGLGFERLIMLATGVENIRDVIPYPRYPGHAEF